MLAAVKLKREYRLGDIGIIDFDMHWGNGTVDIINELKIEYIEHMAFNDQVGNDYNDWLNQLEDSLKEKFKSCDILFYQAGADPHIDDPLGGELTTEQMRQRDRIVFEYAKEEKKPIVWNLAVGYQIPIDKVIELHLNTVEECIKTYKK